MLSCYYVKETAFEISRRHCGTVSVTDAWWLERWLCACVVHLSEL